MSKALELFRSVMQLPTGDSFDLIRAQNNVTDVYVRLGTYYEHLAETDPPPEFQGWLSKPEELATTLERSAKELIALNAEGPITPPLFVTAAQALGTSAGLRKLANQDPTRQLRMAGLYLRIASGFETKNLPDWEPICFCSALVPKKGLHPAFAEGISVPLDGMPIPDLSLFASRLRKQCSSNTGK